MIISYIIRVISYIYHDYKLYYTNYKLNYKSIINLLITLIKNLLITLG